MLSFIKEATVRAEEDSLSPVNGTETSTARVLGYISLPGMLRFIRYSQAARGHLSSQADSGIAAFQIRKPIQILFFGP